MRKIRVLVVDDSAFMRKLLTDIIKQDEKIQIVGTAETGYQAIEMAKLLKPDVITLDIELPGVDGLTCLKELMAIGSFKVIMVSSFTRKGQRHTIEALENGAIDFVTKPDNVIDILNSNKKNEILDKIKIAFNIKTIEPKCEGKINLEYRSKRKKRELNTIVAIGTSTGGPRALQEVIPHIPKSVPAAFLVVQHMPSGFTASLAARLNKMSQLTVKEAEDGERIKRGHVYIAPGGFHMKVSHSKNNELCIKITEDPPVGNHRPSVDVLLGSMYEAGLKNTISVILTGMGSDGSRGITQVKKLKNSLIFAQDEETSIIYGMPKSALNTGLVDRVIPLDKIALEITNALEVR